MDDQTLPKKENRGGARTPVTITEMLIRRVALLTVGGANITQIAQELSIDRSVVRKILNKDECKSIVEEIEREGMATAKAIIRSQTSQLATKIIKVINDHLDNGNLEAVKVGLKILGFNEQEQVKQNDTSITVVLPGSAVPPKEVKADIVNVEPERE